MAMVSKPDCNWQRAKNAHINSGSFCEQMQYAIHVDCHTINLKQLKKTVNKKGV